MSYGDPTNARSWTNANVFISFDDGGGFADLPASINDEMPSGWDQVGLLDGNQGFTESTTETVTNTFAWGQILLASRISDQTTTKSFVALEVNEVTDRLQFIENGTQFRRSPERVRICFERLDAGRGVAERRMSAFEAEVRINGDRQETETGVVQIPFIATIFPGSSLELWDIQRGNASA